MSHGKFSDRRYEEIKQEVLFMFEETETDAFPIDPFEIARKLQYAVIPYSKLPFDEYLEAIDISNEGYSKVMQHPATGMLYYAIFYNDEGHSIRNIRWTIFHEIGHIYLGHHDNSDGNEQLEEDEANFFAKYSIAPPPLINATKCADSIDVYNTFGLSDQASGFVFEYFQKWLNYGPKDYLPYELQMLRLFHLAAA